MTSKPGIPSDSSHTYVEWAVLAASCRFDSSSALLHKYSNSATTYLAHTQHTVHISVHSARARARARHDTDKGASEHIIEPLTLSEPQELTYEA